MMRQSGQAYDDTGYDEFDIPRATASFRVSRKRPGADRTTRNMVIVAASVAGLMIAGVGVQALLRPHGLPVVAAQNGPWREKPANPGGMHVMGEGNAIYGGTHAATQDQVMPGPEKPDLAALKRDEHAAPPASAPAAVTPAQPAGTALAPPPAGPITASAATAAPPDALPLPPLPTAPPPMPAAVPAPQIASVSTPAPALAAAPSDVAAVVSGGPQVQLAALTSDAGARAEWAMLVAKMPTLLGGRAPIVTKAVVNGQTWFRLRTGGFASLAAAQDFCTQVRAQGGACAADRS